MSKITNNDYAPGTHILLDFFGIKNSNDVEFIRETLLEAAKACKATVLDIKLHSFGENNGITGVALLAESHISIHTWPENEFAAIDVFMCGNCDATQAIEPLEKMFKPKKSSIKEIQRGS